MLMKFYVFMLILLFQNFYLCDADEKEKKSLGNRTIPFNTNSGRFKKLSNKMILDAESNSTANTFSVKGRYLNEYFVMTCEGHVLSTYRLTYMHETMKSKRCPVLLVHGLFQSSDVFLEQDEDKSLAFQLQDLGHDVWLANTRGNRNNKVHIIYEPRVNETEKNEYFNYTYEEIGTLDIAATVDFILNVTKFKKILYIGYSIGGTVFLVLNSMKPEYNKKFAKAYLLAPFGYQREFPDKYLRHAANHAEFSRQDIAEMFPYTDENAEFSVEDCLGNKTYGNICEQINIDANLGLTPTNNNVEKTRIGSIGPLYHLAQNIKWGTFSRWDYGEFDNHKHYKAATPPKYNLSLVTVPTILIYALHDKLVSPEDIANMAKDMGNAHTREVKRISFEHGDFLFGRDAMKNVYAEIIDELQKRPNICEEPVTVRHGFFWDYIWLWAAILLIILFALIACCLCSCNKKSHGKEQSRLGAPKAKASKDQRAGGAHCVQAHYACSPQREHHAPSSRVC